MYHIPRCFPKNVRLVQHFYKINVILRIDRLKKKNYIKISTDTEISLTKLNRNTDKSCQNTRNRRRLQCDNSTSTKPTANIIRNGENSTFPLKIWNKAKMSTFTTLI
jgi:hypothetical protein